MILLASLFERKDRMSGKQNFRMLCFCMVIFGLTACASKEVVFETGEGSETVQTGEMLQEEDTKALIYVYVCGRVKNPGVYVLSEGDRLFQAVEMAGGPLPDSDVTKINMAQKLEDGQKIYIPSPEEAETMTETAGAEVPQGAVNINSATRELLMTLPGIGESKADAIVAYRQSHGPFGSLEALMDVPGIKEGVYEKIKDRISIN